MTTTTNPTYRAQTDPTTKKWHLGSAERGTTSYCGVRLIEPGDDRAFARKVAEADRHIEVDGDIERVDCGACRRNREWKYAHGTDRPATATPRASRRTRPSAARTHASAADIAAALENGSASLSRQEAGQMAEAAAVRNGDEPRPSVQRAELDARVLALLATYPAGQRRGIADVRGGMDPAPSMAKLKASLGRLVRADKATLASGGYALAEAPAPSADATVAAIDAALAAGPDAPAPVADGTAGPEVTLTPGERAGARRGRAPRTGNPRADRAATARPLSRAAKVRALVESGECATPAEAKRYLADMGE